MVDLPRPPDRPPDEPHGSDRWRPVEYGNGDANEALREIEADAEEETSRSTESLEYDAEIVDRLPEWKRGEKTRARLVTPDGSEHYFDSGKRAETRDALRDSVPRIDYLWAADHVEAHVSAEMRRGEISDAVLYINRVPCEGRLGCAELLPWMLPPDSTLTIYGPENYTQTFNGDSR